jgi:phosphoglycerate dehydrogenase-like enzyme
MAAATRRGIPVVFAPGGSATAVAESTLAMIIALVKKLPQLSDRTRAGDWSARDTTAIGDMKDTTIGIVGLGRIGREVAHMAAAFGMHILAYDPYISSELAVALGAKLVGLNFLLAESDCITFHIPLNNETRGVVSSQMLAQIKRGAILVNLSRGGLLESLDVIYDALDSGRLSAVGMDVYPNEPPDVSHPIFSHPDVLCTPHAMGLSIRATTETYAMVTKGMADVLEGRIPTNVVNSEVFARSK